MPHCGIFLHCSGVMGASPDGIILSPDGAKKVLEIKCPESLAKVSAFNLVKEVRNSWIQIRRQIP